MSMLDSLFGIQRLFVDGIEVVIRQGLDLVGATYSEELIDGVPVARVVLGDALAFTAVQSGDYAAAYGDLARVAGSYDVTLPLAATRANGRVAVMQMSGSSSLSVVPSGSDTIANGAIAVATLYAGVILQSDGVSIWYVVGSFGGGV
jgi:hypothetical protein